MDSITYNMTTPSIIYLADVTAAMHFANNKKHECGLVWSIDMICYDVLHVL